MSSSVSLGRILKQLPKLHQNSFIYTQRRTLLTDVPEVQYKTSAEVIQALSQNVIGGPQTYDPNLYHKKREDLLKILPTEQSQLPPRRMIESYDAAIIPIASNPSLKDKYLVADGGVRIGRLLEDMDIFSVHLVFKHVLNPLQAADSSASPWTIVTGLVDQIDFTGTLRPDCDIRMSGHVTWVGKTSAESTLHLEQLVDGQWIKLTEALFVLVARDPLNRGSAFINPLNLVTKEEKDLFAKGEMNKKRLYLLREDLKKSSRKSENALTTLLKFKSTP